MSNESIGAAYARLNLSYHKTLVFRLGADSGFFSEYNNMVLAILYCLKHKIRFSLSSNHSNFSSIGWTEFFIPFCPEVKSAFHFKKNVRAHHPISGKHNLLIKLYTICTGRYLTQHLWNSFHSAAFETERFAIEPLQIKGNTLAAARTIVNLTWTYQAKVASQVEHKIKEAQLPREYLSIHIRRGDKQNEAVPIPVSCYIEKLMQLSAIKNIFVATDDYAVITELHTLYPSFNFYHLTKQEAKGYDQLTFNQLGKDVKYNDLIDLFTTVDILSASKLFVGTFSSNIGMYMAMRLGTEKVYGVDREEWKIW